MGKFIEQRKKARIEFLKLREDFPKYEEEINKIGGDISSCKKNIKNILIEIKAQNPDLFKRLDIAHKHKQIKHSYNKNKGQWLQNIYDHVFERVNLFQKQSSVTWRDNIIHNQFLLENIKINRKEINSFGTIDINYYESLEKLKLTFFTNNISNINKKLCGLIEGRKDKIEETNLKNVSNKIDNVLFTSISLHNGKGSYNCEINFEVKPNLKEFIQLLKELELLSVNKINKLKTDITYKINSKISILELKNNEFTPLDKDAIYQCVAYGIREKIFNKSKFKTLDLIYYGNLSENFNEILSDTNKKLKDEYNFNIEIIKVQDHLDYIKNKYFDDETNKRLIKKDITCWDFNRLTMRYNNHAGSCQGVYMPIFSLDRTREFKEIIVDADFEFKFKDYIKSYVEQNENANKKKEELLEMGRRLFENE